MQIKCPNCSWHPEKGDFWICEHCKMDFDMFEEGGKCPYCRHQHEDALCPSWKGGCGEVSPHLDWYSDIDKGMQELNIFRSE